MLKQVWSPGSWSPGVIPETKNKMFFRDGCTDRGAEKEKKRNEKKRNEKKRKKRKRAKKVEKVKRRIYIYIYKYIHIYSIYLYIL